MFEPTPTVLQLDLISILVNFTCELGQVMRRYDFLEDMLLIVSDVRNDSNLP